MNRTLWLKFIYLSLFVLVLVTVIYLTKTEVLQLPNLLLITLICLIPGRLVGYFYRDLLTARRLIDRGRWQQSIPYSLRFTNKIRQHKWLKIFIWFAPSLYTISPLAMGLNNLGVAHLELGEIERAEEYFWSALRIDQKYSLPYYSLAIIELLRENTSQGEYYLAKSNRLGYSQGKIDSALDRGKAIYARIGL